MGYKNITGMDAKIHSQSAKGIKQSQKISFLVSKVGNVVTEKQKKTLAFDPREKLFEFRQARRESLDKFGVGNFAKRRKYIAKKMGLKEHQVDELFSKLNEIVLDRSKRLKITKVEIMRAEGNTAIDSNIGKTQVYKSVKEANARLKNISASIPKENKGYDKTDVTVHFEDGSTYKGRWDVQNNYSEYPDNDVKGHIRDFFKYYAGENSRGREAIEKGWTSKEEKNNAQDWLTIYDI